MMPPRVLASGPKPCGGNNFYKYPIFKAHNQEKNKISLNREGNKKVFLFPNAYFTAFLTCEIRTTPVHPRKRKK